MLRNLDVPPLWLGLALLASWALSGLWAWPFPRLGSLIFWAGLITIVLAGAQMLRARTTIIPRQQAAKLLTTGLFGLSRNPIYLADAMLLTGAILHWGAVLALPLIPAFMVLITLKFICAEEDQLRQSFGEAFASWSARVPRWIWKI
jgi:protein-S-isoprenylcysteine O-methyltransferase Ste14